MADLDSELQGRLSRLAAAVPVAPAQVDPVHGRAVAARVRIAWVTPLVAIVGLAFLGTLSGALERPAASGSASPAGVTPSPAGDEPTGSVVARDEDGPFSLELRAERGRFAPDEAIEIVATLGFAGPDESAEIVGDSTGPIMFGIREPVFGEIRVGGVSILMVERTTLRRDEPLVEAFRKGGGFDGDHPDAGMFRRWFEDPVLRLPEGTWHILAISGGTVRNGGLAGRSFELETEIEIVVDDDPAATPGHPAPTEWAEKPVYGGDDIGWAGLQLKSEMPRYEAGTPVEISASYWFADGRPDLIASHFEPELALSIEQLDAEDPQVLVRTYDSTCTDLGRVEGKEFSVPLGPHNVTRLSADDPALLDRGPEPFAAKFEGGALRLPVGRWRITASVAGTFAHCGEAGERYDMNASVAIEVVATPSLE